jgi:hypothetical protein
MYPCADPAAGGARGGSCVVSPASEDAPRCWWYGGVGISVCVIDLPRRMRRDVGCTAGWRSAGGGAEPFNLGASGPGFSQFRDLGRRRILR